MESLLSLTGTFGKKETTTTKNNNTLFQSSQITSQIASYGWQKEGSNRDNDNKFHCKIL